MVTPRPGAVGSGMRPSTTGSSTLHRSFRRRESQVFTLGFTYKINNGNTRKEKRRGEDGGGGMDMDME